MVNSIGNSYNQYNYYNSLIRQFNGNNTSNVPAILYGGYQNNNNTASLNTASKTQLSAALKDVRESFGELKTSAQALVTSNQNSVFKKTDSSAIVSAVKDFAGKYNETVETLQDNKDVLNNKLLKNLTTAAQDNKSRLSEIGITVNNDKTLTIDADKLKKAVADNLTNVKSLLGSTGGIANKVAKVATNTLSQPLAGIINPSNEKKVANAQYQAQLNQYFSNTYSGSFAQLYGLGGLLDTSI